MTLKIVRNRCKILPENRVRLDRSFASQAKTKLQT